MSVIFYVIVGFLFVLAVFDLFVGVSNDAVNFLNSSVGARVASFRTILMVASAGVLLGALLSGGMMDVARHGVMHPSYFSFKEVITIFLAVMVTDVLVLDMFNNKGMPTSTTVSLVFELLGASFIMAVLKTAEDSSLSLDLLLNGNKAFTMIIAIFVSVAIAFASGLLVQWLSRLLFTFNYKAKLGKFIGVFGGIAFTTLAYFIFVKGIFVSPYLSETVRIWINQNTTLLLILTFLFSGVISQFLHILKVNVFKIIILSGTFSLAMAFAGNDLVNFIGVSLAAVDSLKDFVLNGSGNPDSFMMTSLEDSAKSPMIYLLIAGIIMIMALVTSKKAHHVIKTEVSLSRNGDGSELFGSSPVARVLVRGCRGVSKVIDELMPMSVRNWIASRFDKRQAIIAENAAFDELRASINLILSALLIAMGTSLTLPLSTTYVTFMVAMGSSLADKAWNKETAVFRVTGVLKVMGSWFLTAGIAFIGAAMVCLIMYYGGFPSMVGFMLLVGVILFFSKRSFEKEHMNTNPELIKG